MLELTMRLVNIVNTPPEKWEELTAAPKSYGIVAYNA